MDAGKSTILLQTAHNYSQRGMNTFLLTAAIDDRYGVGKISSRLGISAEAHIFNNEDNILRLIKNAHKNQEIHCVLIDESHFLSKKQVGQLTEIVDKMSIPVLCYGLRTDFMGELFEGSKYLLAWADKLEEIKTICDCGRKATMVLRLDSEGKALRGGEQISIGGNETYKSVCRKHFNDPM